MRIKVKNLEEFVNTKRNDIEISRRIVYIILQNLKNTSKDRFLFLTIELSDENEIKNYYVHRDDFIDVLEKNLKIHELHERYEDCIKIKEAIEYLKNDNI